MGEINIHLQQRDIVSIDLEPTVGHEQSGTRPAVIISSDDFSLSGMIIICPLTTRLKDFPGSIRLNPCKENGISAPSEILTSQIRTVSTKRIIKKIGQITQTELNQLFENMDLLFDR